jgi:hypothetical protein
MNDKGNDNDNEEQQVCKLREPHPENLNAKETPRYQLCRLPSSSSETLRLQRFPIDGFNAVYYSNMGSILPSLDEHGVDNNVQQFSNIETVLVIVHGSGRNADDYLCAGISTAAAISKRDENHHDNSETGPRSENSKNTLKTDMESGKVLVIAPKFVADVDVDDRRIYRNTLYWMEGGKDVPLGHSWRYVCLQQLCPLFIPSYPIHLSCCLFFDPVRTYRNHTHTQSLSLSHRYGADAANKYGTGGLNTSKTGDDSRDNSRGDIHDFDNSKIYQSSQNGISSYAVMDRLLEFLISSKHAKNEERSLRQSIQQQRRQQRQHEQHQQEFHFPNLKRIVVAGHSAGGQYVHRWALLSSSPMIWGDGNDSLHKDERRIVENRKVEVRAIVANPRSYCYPDNRRMIRIGEDHASDSDRLVKNHTVGVQINFKDGMRLHPNSDEQYNYVYAVPDPRDVDICPTYDQWQWGLEPGGDVPSPYKDAALDFVQNNLTALALRYSKRRVFYLVGEHDTIVQEDRCETYDYQGDTRNERGRRYFRALSEYFTTWRENSWRSTIESSTSSDSTKLIHEFHQVPGSPHDHTLMFQSAFSMEAIFGTGQNCIDDIEQDHSDGELVHDINVHVTGDKNIGETF